MNNSKEKSLEKTIYSISGVEWFDFYFSRKQRKRVFWELREFEQIFDKINIFSEYAFTFDKKGLEKSCKYIKFLIIKSVVDYIEQKYEINLQIKYPKLKISEAPYVKDLLRELKNQKPKNLKP